MLFKKIHKVDDDLIEEVLDYETMKKRLLKKEKMKKQVKSILTTSFIFFGLIGGYRAYGMSNAMISNPVVDEAFIGDYVENYYLFPQTDSSKEYLDTYAFVEEDSIDYSDIIEYASAKNVSVYDSVVDEQVTTFYFTYDHEVKIKEKEIATISKNAKIDVMHHDDAMRVVSSIIDTTIKHQAINDEYLSDVLKVELPGTTVEAVVKDDATNTLNLFLKTYNEDIIQARLLCSSPSVIETLDFNASMELESIHEIKGDENSLYIITNMKTIDKQSMYTRKTKVYFEIDIQSNKIKVMEGI